MNLIDKFTRSAKHVFIVKKFCHFTQKEITQKMNIKESPFEKYIARAQRHDLTCLKSSGDSL